MVDFAVSEVRLLGARYRALSMSFPERGNRTFSALPAVVFRSLHEDMAYHYKLVHFRTLGFALQTICSPPSLA